MNTIAICPQGSRMCPQCNVLTQQKCSTVWLPLTRQSDTDTFWLEVAFIWKQKSIKFRSIKQYSNGLICFSVYLVGNMRTKRHQNQDILFSTLPSTTWQSSVCSYEWNMTQVLKIYKHGAGDFSDGRLTTRPNWPKKVRQLKQDKG